MNAIKYLLDTKHEAKENFENSRDAVIQHVESISCRRANFFYTSMVHCIYADVYDYFLESGCIKAHLKNISFLEDSRCGSFFQYAIMYCALKFFAENDNFADEHYLFDTLSINKDTYEEFKAIILKNSSDFEVAFSKKIISTIFNQLSNALSLAFVENFFYNSYIGWVKKIPPNEL